MEDKKKMRKEAEKKGFLSKLKDKLTNPNVKKLKKKGFDRYGRRM